MTWWQISLLSWLTTTWLMFMSYWISYAWTKGQLDASTRFARNYKYPKENP